MFNERDAKHLKALSIAHYVYSGISALFSLFPLIYVFIGILMIFLEKGRGEESVQGVTIGAILAAGGLIGFLIGLSLSVLIALSGFKMARGRSWTFCVVVSCVECAFFPLGTSLGILALLTLFRGSVRESFEKLKATNAVASQA